MRITSKGQVTIPQDIRDHAGFQPGTEVEFVLGEDGHVHVIAAAAARAARAQRLDRALAGLSGSADAGLSTDEIMALTRA